MLVQSFKQIRWNPFNIISVVVELVIFENKFRGGGLRLEITRGTLGSRSTRGARTSATRAQRGAGIRPLQH